MRAFASCAPIAFFLSLSILDVSVARSEEPNETFAQATILEPGTLSVSDALFEGTGSAPDTYLGVFDQGGFDPFENLITEADDGSTLGDEQASGLADIDVNSDGSIRFMVTGAGDLFFDGDHEENGGYKAFVDVFNSSGVRIDDFPVNGTLQAGVADPYTFANNNWQGGTFSINIDNTIDGFTGGDVDFFTFTGLAAGVAFSAETKSIGSIDTLLGWYSDAGSLIAQDDDSGAGPLSLLSGVVPASGKLTFAVTGSGDDTFLGEHAQQEFYDLQLSVAGAGLEGDFDGNGEVNSADLSHPTLGWQTRYGADLDGADLLAWQRQFGSSATISAAVAVPEPASVQLLVSMLFGLLVWAKLNR